MPTRSTTARTPSSELFEENVVVFTLPLVLAKLKKAVGTPPPPAAGRIGTPLSTETPPPVATTSGPTTTITSPIVSTTERVKLPKISLPHFRGNLMRWPAFWDLFNSAIHSNERLSEIDKFNYLRLLLEGTAYDAIAGLALSAANYGEAVEILRKRFGNNVHLLEKFS